MVRHSHVDCRQSARRGLRYRLDELDFPTTPGSYQPRSAGCSAYNLIYCPFVAKFNSAGTALLYSTFVAGSETGTANGIVLDANGDAFIAGSTASTDFPITAGAVQTHNHASGAAGFVTELDSTGTSLLYSTYLGGSTYTTINQIAIDDKGNAYVTGNTWDTNFPVTKGAYQTTAINKGSNLGSAFITKVNPGGTALVYSTYLGGRDPYAWDESLAIAVDSKGEAYVGGNTSSNDFPVTKGALQVAREGPNMYAGFVTKLNASGSALVYSTYLGGNGHDSVNAIALDSNGNAYATGSTTSPDFPITAGAFQSKIGISGFGYPQANVFVSELNNDGKALVYSTFLGGSTGFALADEGDEANGIALDPQGMVYLTGMACTIQYPVTTGAFEPTNLDMWNSAECTAFLTKMNPAPDAPLLYDFLWRDREPGRQRLLLWGGRERIGARPVGQRLPGRLTLSVDFPTTAGVFKTAFRSPGPREAFVAEFNGSEMTTLPVPTVKLKSSASSVLFGKAVTFTATVKSASGKNAPTGYVGFNFIRQEMSDVEGTDYGMGPWTTVALNGAGMATFTTSSLEVLQTQVKALYLGDANNAPASAR